MVQCVVKEVPMQVSRAVESEQGTQALAATQVSTLQVTNHTDTHMGL